MDRDLNKQLKTWATSTDRKPLVIRGARQVGKTHLVDTLALDFDNYINLNLEIETSYHSCFNNLEPQDIVNAISFKMKKEITPGKTLLFLDEIQALPRAIMALRYFRERMPELHVIAAGSLLEFALHNEDVSMPVGRVEYLFVHPCSFEEFLPASQRQILPELSVQSPPAEAIHEELLKQFKNYMVTGGMPEAVNAYLTNGDLYKTQRIQNAILQTYRDDFGKYASHAELKYLQTVYDKTPGMVGTQIFYNKIDAEARSRDLKRAIQLLEYAGLVKRVIASSASGLPLITTANEKKFKLQFLDVGLVQRASGLNIDLLLTQDIDKLNDGALAEQIVGQMLLAHEDPFMTPSSFFWCRDKPSSQAEVDYVINLDGQIIPIEVKSGATGRLKSLHLLMKEQNLSIGVKVSAAPLSVDNAVLNVPFYLVGQLRRLVLETKTK